MLTKPDIKVHPSADAFPMWTDEITAQVVADMKATGFDPDYPIDRLEDGTLIDGRNRFRAAEQAEVQPVFRTFVGDDDAINAKIVRANIGRRDLSAGQKALAVALIYPEGEHGGKRVKDVKASSTLNLLRMGVSKAYLSYARFVIANAPEYVEAVKQGSMSLAGSDEAAYEMTRAAKQAREEKASDADKRVTALRKRYPDLAAKVTSGEMRIALAEKKANDLDTETAETRRNVIMRIEQWINITTSFGADADALDDEEIGKAILTRVKAVEIRDRLNKIATGHKRLRAWLAALIKESTNEKDGG